MERLRCSVANSTVIGFALATPDKLLVRSLLPNEVTFVTAETIDELLMAAHNAAAPILVYRLPQQGSHRGGESVSTNAVGASLLLTRKLHDTMSRPLSDLPAVALCHGDSVGLAFLAALRELGHVRILATDAPGAVRRLWPLLEQALASSIAARLRRSIGDIENALVAKVMAVALPLAGRCLMVSDVARVLGIHERTLRKRLLNCAAPSPQWLVGWARLLVAAWHLRDATRTASDVAAQLEFSALQNLCRMVRRYTGHSLSNFRADDPVALASQCFVESGGRPLGVTQRPATSVDTLVRPPMYT